MEKSIRKYGIHESKNFTCDRMLVILRNIERSDYAYDYKNLGKLFHEKYGHPQPNFVDSKFSETYGQMSEWKGFIYPNTKDEKHNDYISKVHSRIYDIQERYRQKQYDLFWDRLKRNHERFWD